MKKLRLTKNLRVMRNKDNKMLGMFVITKSGISYVNHPTMGTALSLEENQELLSLHEKLNTYWAESQAVMTSHIHMLVGSGGEDA